MANQIQFRSPSDVLTRGQAVTVPVVLVVDSPLKVRGIHVRFHGAEETKATYTTTSTDGKGNVTTHTHTAVEHTTITENSKLLAGRERRGFFFNLGDAVAGLFGLGRHQMMKPDEHEYEIEVVIPANAPPTHTGDRSRVFYELTAQVDVPFGRDLKATHSFRVAPLPRSASAVKSARVRYPDDEGRGFWDSLFAPDTRMELALAADTLSTGQSIEGTFGVQTDQPLDIRAIRVRLVGHEQSQANGHSDSHEYRQAAVELATPRRILGVYSEHFSLNVQIDGPPTAKGKLFSIDWFVQIELDVPWVRDPKIRAPITLTRSME